MNNVNLIGRLTRDPELKYTQDGKAVGNFSIAVTKKFKKDEADFLNCVAWGKTAELIAEYLRKGNQLGVSGSIATSTWEKDGVKQYKTEILVDQITFIGSKSESSPKTENTPTANNNNDTEEFPF